MEQSERRKVDPNLGKENFGGIGNPDTEWAQDLSRPPTKSEKIEDAQWAEKIQAAKANIEVQNAPMLDSDLLEDEVPPAPKQRSLLNKLKKIFGNNNDSAQA